VRRCGAVIVGVFAALGACEMAPREQSLVSPRTLTTPYDATTGEVLWAVVPLRNESGTTHAEDLAMADKLVAACEEAEGVRAVPLNRTIEAMRALGMRTVASPGEARRLATAMGVDGVLVGTITAYDPYTPRIGLAVALFARPGAMSPAPRALNPRDLSRSPTDGRSPGTEFADRPIASASLHLDGRNHQVQMDVRDYAEGRMKGPSALGWRRYLSSADLFGDFAAYRVVEDLVRSEWQRLGRVTTQAEGAR
jgi:hypothetical protein